MYVYNVYMHVCVYYTYPCFPVNSKAELNDSSNKLL